jgi:hypothetical protein
VEYVHIAGRSFVVDSPETIDGIRCVPVSSVISARLVTCSHSRQEFIACSCVLVRHVRIAVDMIAASRWCMRRGH